MSSLTSPYGSTCCQNSGVSPRRSRMWQVSPLGFGEDVLEHQGVHVR